MDAERELVQWKKVRFMADKVGDEFDGYVTGVSAFGLFVELVEHFVEGLVHVSPRWPTTTTATSTRPHVLHGERTRRACSASATACACRCCASTRDRRLIDLGLVELLEADARTAGRARRRARAATGAGPQSERRRHTARQPRRGKAAVETVTDEAHRRRHGRTHRSRQERARARAHRHRSRPAEGGEGPRHHHRPRVRALGDRRASASASSTCPGHERFVKNMLAGVGGIDAVMLVVAADESVMPQTREHFDDLPAAAGPRRLRRPHQGGLGRRRHARPGARRGARPRRRVVPRRTRPSWRCRRGPGAGLDDVQAPPARPRRGRAGRRDGRAGPAARRPRVLDARVRDRRHRHARVRRASASTTTADRAARRPRGEGARAPGARRAHATRRGRPARGREPRRRRGRRPRARADAGATPAPSWRRRACSTRGSSWSTPATPLRHGARVRFHQGTSEVLGRVAVSSRVPAPDAAAPRPRRPRRFRPAASAYARLRLESPGRRHARRPVRAAGILAADHDCRRCGARPAAAARRHPHGRRAGPASPNSTRCSRPRPPAPPSGAALLLAHEGGQMGLPRAALTAAPWTAHRRRAGAGGAAARARRALPRWARSSSLRCSWRKSAAG